MLAGVESGEFDAVVSWSFDRLTRNRRDTVKLIETCQAHATTIAMVRGSDMDMSTPGDRWVADMLAGVARHEIEQKSDRQKRAALQLARSGHPPAGPIPFGFLPDRLTHHPEQSAAIRDAYSSLLAGATLAGVARSWNAAGLLSGRPIETGPRPRPLSLWRAETVRALLLKPRNAGLRAFNGEIIGTGEWDPIVAEETWRAVVALLSDPGRRGAPPAARHLLSGVALCGTCGAPVVAGSTTPTYFSYRCNSRGHVARRGDHADAYVAGGTIEGVTHPGLVVARLSRPDAVDLLPREDGPDVAALRDRAQALRAKLDGLAVQFADDVITESQLRTMTTRTRENLADAQAELAVAGRTSVVGPPVTAPDVVAVWAGLDVDRKRAVIDTLMTITLHPPGRGARYFDPATLEVTPKGMDAMIAVVRTERTHRRRPGADLCRRDDLVCRVARGRGLGSDVPTAPGVSRGVADATDVGVRSPGGRVRVDVACPCGVAGFGALLGWRAVAGLGEP